MTAETTTPQTNTPRPADGETPEAFFGPPEAETVTDLAETVVSIVTDAMADPELFLDTVFAPYGGE